MAAFIIKVRRISLQCNAGKLQLMFKSLYWFAPLNETPNNGSAINNSRRINVCNGSGRFHILIMPRFLCFTFLVAGFMAKFLWSNVTKPFRSHLCFLKGLHFKGDQAFSMVLLLLRSYGKLMLTIDACKQFSGPWASWNVKKIVFSNKINFHALWSAKALVEPDLRWMNSAQIQ